VCVCVRAVSWSARSGGSPEQGGKEEEEAKFAGNRWEGGAAVEVRAGLRQRAEVPAARITICRISE